MHIIRLGRVLTVSVGWRWPSAFLLLLVGAFAAHAVPAQAALAGSGSLVAGADAVGSGPTAMVEPLGFTNPPGCSTAPANWICITSVSGDTCAASAATPAALVQVGGYNCTLRIEGTPVSQGIIDTEYQSQGLMRNTHTLQNQASLFVYTFDYRCSNDVTFYMRDMNRAVSGNRAAITIRCL